MKVFKKSRFTNNQIMEAENGSQNENIERIYLFHIFGWCFPCCHRTLTSSAPLWCPTFLCTSLNNNDNESEIMDLQQIASLANKPHTPHNHVTGWLILQITPKTCKMSSEIIETSISTCVCKTFYTYLYPIPCTAPAFYRNSLNILSSSPNPKVY